MTKSTVLSWGRAVQSLRRVGLSLPRRGDRAPRPPQRLVALLSVMVGVGLSWSGAAMAQDVTTTFVRLGMGVPAVLYQPIVRGPKAAISVLVMHPEGDYLTMAPCTELSARGYSVLCVNSSVSKPAASADFSLDKVLLQTKLAVAYLRGRQDVRKVVLLGHSGGGSLMTAYQNIAENGVKACQTAEVILKCPDSLAGLLPADGVVLIDSNYGLPTMMLFSLDGAVTDEAHPQQLDPSLDLYNPANGFKPGGSHYGAAFIQRWQKAIAARNNRLIKDAIDRLTVIESGAGRFKDDDIFVIPGANYAAFNNKLFAQDTNLLSHTKHAWPLVRKDGSVVTQIVHTVRVPENDMPTTASFEDGSEQTTVRHFLGTYAVRVDPNFSFDADSINGVEWASSYDTPEAAVRGITRPLLTMGLTAHWEFLAAEMIYDNAASRDKSIAFIEGATHLFTTCKDCERTPGEFGDTLKTTFDYVDGWLSKPGRF